MTTTTAATSITAEASATGPVVARLGLRAEVATCLALVQRDLRRFVRQRSRVLGSLAQPLILWAVLGAGFGSSFRAPMATPVDYLQYFYPGMVVLTLLFSAIFSTMSVIEDRHHGFLQAVLVGPASRAALVLGKALGGSIVAMAQAVLLLLLSPLAGFSLAGASWPYLLTLLSCTALGFTAIGFAVAWWIDSTQGYHAIMSVALIPLWMLSGAMFPAEGAGGVIRTLMRLDPMTYAVAGLRRGLYGDGLPAALADSVASAGTCLLVTAGLAAVAVTAAVALCRRRA